MYDPFHGLLVAQRVAVEHERRLRVVGFALGDVAPHELHQLGIAEPLQFGAFRPSVGRQPRGDPLRRTAQIDRTYPPSTASPCCRSTWAGRRPWRRCRPRRKPPRAPPPNVPVRGSAPRPRNGRCRRPTPLSMRSTSASVSTARTPVRRDNLRASVLLPHPIYPTRKTFVVISAVFFSDSSFQNRLSCSTSITSS